MHIWMCWLHAEVLQAGDNGGLAPTGLQESLSTSVKSFLQSFEVCGLEVGILTGSWGIYFPLSPILERFSTQGDSGSRLVGRVLRKYFTRSFSIRTLVLIIALFLFDLSSCILIHLFHFFYLLLCLA